MAKSLKDQAHFINYDPATFGWSGAHDPMKDADLLVPFTHSGVTFAGDMHRDVVGLFTALLDELVPLVKGGLVAGICGCYNPNSKLQDGSRSFHTYAIAIDVNWDFNPMGEGIAHPTGKHTLPFKTSDIARKYGCEWGGDWLDFKDFMHIEVHVAPDVARTVKPIVEIDLLQEDDMLLFTVVVDSKGKAIPAAQRTKVLVGPGYFRELSKAEAGLMALGAKDCGSINEAQKAILRKVALGGGQT